MIAVNPLPAQLWSILWAASAGVFCGMLYDIFREIRWHCRRKWVELLLDSIFSVTAAAVVFVLVTGAAQLRLRGFLLAALVAAWMLWSISIGRLFRWLLHTAFRGIGYIGGQMRHLCTSVISRLPLHRRKRAKSCGVSKESRKKQKKNFHFHLW